MGFLDRVMSVLETVRGDDEPRVVIAAPDPFDDPFDELEAEIKASKAALAEALEEAKKYKRISGEYFAVIEKMECERDDWKDMFFTQSMEHQTAQGMLRRAGVEYAQQLKHAVIQLNFFRKEAGMDPIQEAKNLKDFPREIPEDYGKRMKALADAAPPQTDGKAERARITQVAERRDQLAERARTAAERNAEGA